MKDRPLKIFFTFAFLILSLVIFIGCSSREDYLINSSSPIQSTYYITQQETSLPMTISLKEGESFYLESCEIKIEFTALTTNYPDYGNNRAYITSNYNCGNAYTFIEYDSMNGVLSYYAENETNYVFDFNGIYPVGDHYELEITIDRYYYL
jgi:hypothetical protein